MARSPHRFHLPTPPEQGLAQLVGDELHHLRHVLRLRNGDAVTLFDGRGREYDGEVLHLTKTSASVRICGERCVPPPPLSLAVGWGLCKARAAELLLQKGTELGASSFHPFLAERSAVDFQEDRAGRALRRWRATILQAAKQSGSCRLPTLSEPRSFPRLLADTCHYERRVLLHPGSPLGLPQVLRGIRPRSLLVLIGPEGGFAPAELEAAEMRGLLRASMGGPVLRTETAALAALAALAFEYLW